MERIALTVFLTTFISHGMAIKHIQIFVIGQTVPDSFSALAYTQPSYQLGVDDANAIHSGNLLLSVDFVSDSTLATCRLLDDNAERLAAEYYYRHIDKAINSNITLVLSATGKRKSSANITMTIR